MSAASPIPEPLRSTVPPEAQAALQARFEMLGRWIADWEERLNTNSTNPSKPPSPDPPSPASGKERGGQPGPRHHARALVPPAQLRQVIVYQPPSFRRCGHDLHGEESDPLWHQAAAPRPAPLCYSGVPTGAFGPRLRAILTVLAGAYRLGKRPIRQAFDPAHVDETSWKQGRAKAWLRVAVTRMVTVFALATSWGAEVAKDLLGSDRRKVVISDRSRCYIWIKRRRACRAHLDRDFQARIDRGGESAEVGRRLPGHSEQLFDWWHRVRDGTMARAPSRSQVDLMRSSFRDDLRRGRNCGYAKTAGTCRELLAGETHPWMSVCVERIEPTNNDAERALRPGVISRKLSGGTQSESGSRFVGRILTVVATWRQQGITVLGHLTRCDQAPPDCRQAPSPIPTSPTAQAA